MIKSFGDGRDWFFEDKLGMFIHWGLYSLSEWHEQVLWRKRLKRKDYEKLAIDFNPINFDPDKWLDLAESAGMTFIVFTVKHLDGFCMYDTKFTDYNIMNTPYGKDILQMVSKACKRRGFKLGLYYSLPDWHHPNYPNYGRHHEMFGQRLTDDVNELKYLEYVKNQVKEICTNYGEICEFFWDENVAEFKDPSINEMLRKLQPNMVINDRGPSEGDFMTPERNVPKGLEFHYPTQACQSLGQESWGYRKDEDYYTTKFIISSIDKILAMGGSYLLNIGPKPDGSIGNVYWESFAKIGAWYNKIKESFIETYPASYILSSKKDTMLLTRKGNNIYVHFSTELQTKGTVVKSIERLPQKAIILNNGQEIKCRVEMLPSTWQQRDSLHLLDLPIEEMHHETMIIKLLFSETELD